VASIDTEQLGYAIIDLGGGRRRKEDRIDPGVGIKMHVRIGDQVEEGQPLATVLARTKTSYEAVRTSCLEAMRIANAPQEHPPIIEKRIS
jgi:thymidine phosphorylase